MPLYTSYGQSFLSQSISSLITNYQEDIRFIEDNKMTYYQLRKKSGEILSTLQDSNDDKDGKEKQDNILKEMIKNNYSKKTYKHSYSSLSHSKEDLKEDDTLFDIYSINKEGESVEGLSMFDKNPKVITCEYNQEIKDLISPATTLVKFKD